MHLIYSFCLVKLCLRKRSIVVIAVYFCVNVWRFLLFFDTILNIVLPCRQDIHGYVG